MARSNTLLKLTISFAALCGALGLQGCEAIREASGSVKTPPDEFTVLTKAPLVIPPDYNLRPPQPGIAARNEVLPDEQAQTALFAVSPEDQLADLGTDYSDGEKLLLSRSQALAADPTIRRTVNADAGEEDFGPEFASKLLFEGAKPPPPREPQQPDGGYVQVASVDTKGFFGRNFGFLGLGDGQNAEAVQQPIVVQPQPQPQPQVVAQASQGAVLQQIAVQAPQAPRAPQPTIIQAPQAVQVPQPVAPQPQAVYAPPQPVAALPQSSAPVEQPGWFTRNFIMSPQQRAALAAGQPVPPSVTQQIEMQQQQQTLQQQVYTAAPAPQAAAAPGQFIAPQVVIAQQPVMPQQMVPIRRPKARNLYQYLFGVPDQAGGGVTPVSLPVQQQPQIVMIPVPAPPQVQQVQQAQAPQLAQPSPAPVIIRPAPAATVVQQAPSAPVIVQQPQAQPPQPKKDGGLFGWLPF
jgi:Protein of unknown function (DUF3035)